MISMSVLLVGNVAAFINNHMLSTYIPYLLLTVGAVGLACATRDLPSGSAPACRQNKITYIVTKHFKLQLCNE